MFMVLMAVHGGIVMWWCFCCGHVVVAGGHGILGIHQEFHMEFMELMLAETPANFLFQGHHGFHVE